MPRDIASTKDAICELHKEWGELVTLRRSVRDAPYDEAAERNLVARLEQHRERLQALRSEILGDAAEDTRAADTSRRRTHD